MALLTPPPNPFALAADILDPPDWEPEDRHPLLPHQVPPEGLGDGSVGLWLLEAGRGAGKTEACARYVARYMRKHPESRGRIIAPTFGDAVEACVEGPSGLLSIDPEIRWLPSAPGGAKLKWSNGSEVLVIGTPAPRDVDRLRAGGNRHLDWWEEMAANPNLQEAWDQAAFGLRLGAHPHAIASTTPRNTRAYRAIRGMGSTELVSGISMFDNPLLPASFIERMKEKYEGTRLGKQELYGQLLEDIEGALWTTKSIEAARWPSELPPMRKIVVAIDPAATSKEGADDTGIVVAGIGMDGLGYVLDDQTCHLPPNEWGDLAVSTFHKWEADVIVGEINNGGEMVEHVIATADPFVPYKAVRASRGKATRAQPVAALYGSEERETQVRHVPGLARLEDELCQWVPGNEASPDRLDAMVWALTELFFTEQEDARIVIDYEPVKIGADI